MAGVCCIGLSAGARIIGTYTMSLSILMINMLMSSFFSRERDEEFFKSIETWALLGLNWAQILRYSQIQKKAQTVLVCFLVYCVFLLLASAYLALGSISRKPKCAVPWMYLQMISIIDQSIALSIHLTHSPQHDVYDKSMWYIPTATAYLLLCAYFWMVVQEARREWSKGEGSCEESQPRPATAFSVSSSLANTGEPKTPSFLSQSSFMFQSPRPPILPK